MRSLIYETLKVKTREDLIYACVVAYHYFINTVKPPLTDASQ